MNKAHLIDQAISDLTKELIDRGKLIEAGFAAFAYCVIPKDAPPIQLREMQLAYMAGAEHVWSSLINMVGPSEEPTDTDMQRMKLIQREIDEWRGKFAERAYPTQGNA